MAINAQCATLRVERGPTLMISPTDAMWTTLPLPATMGADERALLDVVVLLYPIVFRHYSYWRCSTGVTASKFVAMAVLIADFRLRFYDENDEKRRLRISLCISDTIEDIKTLPTIIRAPGATNSVGAAVIRQMYRADREEAAALVKQLRRAALPILTSERAWLLARRQGAPL